MARKTDSTPYDALYKKLYSHPAMIRSLLETFAPPEIVEKIDLDSLVAWKSEHISDSLKQRRGDMVWKVNFKNGSGCCYLVIILEFQSSVEHWMAVRIASYTALLWQGIIAAENLGSRDFLPPVFPILVYNGQRPWNAPLNLREMLPAPDKSLAKYQLSQEFFLVDERHIQTRENATNSLAACMAILQQNPCNPKIYRDTIRRLEQIAKGGQYEAFQRDFINWLGLCIFKNTKIESNVLSCSTFSEVNTMLDNNFCNWEQRFFEQGEAKGRAEGVSIGRAEGVSIGRAEGMTLAMKNLIEKTLNRRFGTVPGDIQDRIDAVRVQEELNVLAERAFMSGTLEEFRSSLPYAPGD